jgi:hypothetical protein
MMGTARKWKRSDVIAVIALIVAGGVALMDLHTRYFWNPPARHELTASVFNFEYVENAADSLLKVDIAFQNKGSVSEVVRQVRFILPFPAGVLSEGRGRAIPAHARISWDGVTGIGTVWPDSNVTALADITLGPGDVKLRQLRQPITAEAILRFLRANAEMLPGDRQFVGLEFVTVAPTGEPVTKIAFVAAVDRIGNWYPSDWVPVDLLTGTQKLRMGSGGFLEIQTDEGSIN